MERYELSMPPSQHYLNSYRSPRKLQRYFFPETRANFISHFGILSRHRKNDRFTARSCTCHSQGSRRVPQNTRNVDAIRGLTILLIFPYDANAAAQVALRLARRS